MKKLEFKIDINAPKKRVWEVLTQLDTYEQWVKDSWPGSSYKGEWKEGEQIRFVGDNGGGTLAVLEKCKPFDQIFAKHIAVLLPGGVIDTESDMAKTWTGTTESYTLTEKEGATRLDVVMHAPPDWEEMFVKGWPQALQNIKRLAEG